MGLNEDQPSFLSVFTVYSWRIVFAYYRVLTCNGGVELDSDDSGYADHAAANGGGSNGQHQQDVHHEARMRMHRRHESGSRRQASKPLTHKREREAAHLTQRRKIMYNS